MQGQHFLWTFCEPYFYFSSVFKSPQGGGEAKGGTKRAYYVAVRGVINYPVSVGGYADKTWSA